MTSQGDKRKESDEFDRFITPAIVPTKKQPTKKKPAPKKKKKAKRK